MFIFIVCHSVKWIPNLYELGRLAMDDKRSWPPWVECVTHIAHFLMTLNSSTNFYIYCGKHFNVIPKVNSKNGNILCADFVCFEFLGLFPLET